MTANPANTMCLQTLTGERLCVPGSAITITTTITVTTRMVRPVVFA